MNLFKLVAMIGLDTKEYEGKVKKTTDDAKGFSSKLGGYFATGVKAVAKATVATVTAAAGAVATITKSAIENYAEYEQLVGGVETLFKDSADIVMEYANNAYKTAGMSANEYMNTVTSFSASLLQSLGGDTAEAARMADLAITDMSDNANKLGTDMSMIQNAYQGFAKQNYTMLDNLKLGYGGTREEMNRLIEDANKLKKAQGELADLSIDSYADIVEAIHLVQTEMGITGTTAKEASSTISGSLASAKAAWKNLLTGIADDNANFDTLVNNFVDSVGTAANNLLPRIGTALTGVSKLIDRLVPVIMDHIPMLIEDFLPQIVNSGVKIFESLVSGIGSNQASLVSTAFEVIMTLVNAVLNNLPQIVKLGLDVIVSLANGIANNLDELVPTIVNVVLQIVDVLTDPGTLGSLIDAALAIIIALADGLMAALPDLLTMLPGIVWNIAEVLIKNAPKLLVAAAEIVLSLAKGILQNLGSLLQSAVEIIAYIIYGIGTAYERVVETGAEIVNKVASGFMSAVGQAVTWGKDLIGNFISGILAKWESLKSTVASVAQSVRDFIGFSEPKMGPLSNFHTYAPDMMDLFAKGIKDNESTVIDQIKKTFNFGDLLTGSISFDANGDWKSSMDSMKNDIQKYLGSDPSFLVNGNPKSEVVHSGTIRVEGVNDRNELVAVTEYSIENALVALLRKQARLV